MSKAYLTTHRSLSRPLTVVVLALLSAQGCAGNGDEEQVAVGSGGTASSSGGDGSVVGASGGAISSSGGQESTMSSGGASSGGAPSGSGGEAPGAGGLVEASGGAVALESYAMDLDELFLDAKCSVDTMGPLAAQATCGHLDNKWKIEKKVSFGGETGVKYLVTLRVRGIWEPTAIEGGTEPYPDAPFMVGGDVKAGSGDSAAINYQQFFISVSSPEQTYWLNNHKNLAHDIYKADYEATIEVDGGAELNVVMNDGNERQIANWTKDIFDDMPPYDMSPTLGQLLQLEVIKVEVAP